MARVTVLGSLHYDILVEAPDRPRKGETVAGHGWMPKCGGKGGNQAVAAAKAGAAVSMIGAVGGDAFGLALRANLHRRGVDHAHVVTVPDAASGMSVAIFDAQGDYGAVIVSGANLRLGEGDVANAAALFDAPSILVLQNEVPEAANLPAARAAKRAGGRVILNAAPARSLSDSMRSAVDILVVNAVEAEILGAGPAPQTLDEARDAARHLAKQVPLAIVTAGGSGVACFGEGVDVALPAETVNVASTHGAGDAFVGHFAAALASGASVEAALDKANRAAALLVATPEAERT